MQTAAETGAGAPAPTSPSGRHRPEVAEVARRRSTAPRARGPAGVLPQAWYATGLLPVALVAVASIFLHGSPSVALPLLDVAALAIAAGSLVLLFQRRLTQLVGGLTTDERREQELSAEREELLHQALAATDRERRQLAADLHDGVIQLVSAVTLRTATLARGLRREGGDSRERIGATAEGLDRITVDLQAVTTDLRGLMGSLAGDEIESGGLTGALSSLLVPLAETGVQVEISVGELTCDARARSLLHRVAQEMVRNVATHASARQVSLSVTQDGEGIRLRVADDGRGFDASSLGERRHHGHMGLRLVEQRVQDAGGCLAISSRPGHGTSVEMRLPQASC